MNDINWLKISTALTYYRSMGYRYQEIPWVVPKLVIGKTTQQQPFNVLMSGEDLGCLIGSAEQGLLHIWDKLTPGRYVSASPCFRNEEDYKAGITQRQFFKVELMSIAPANYQLEATALLKDAQALFRTWGAKAEQVETPEGYDLLVNGVEVGNYGCREVDGFKWVFGTGIAEPRFSTALRLK